MNKRTLWGLGLAAGLAGASLMGRDKAWLMARIAVAERRGFALRAALPRRNLGIRFKPGSRLGLDVFAPEGAAQCPVVISIHGGGWSLWPRWVFSFSAPPLLARGLVVVLPDYTLYPRARYPQMADECAAAVAWTLEHIADYGGDPRRVYLQGHSSGAHLSALVALDPRWLAAYGHAPDDLAGLMVSAGVLDIEAEHDHWQSKTPISAEHGPLWGVMGGSREGLRAGSPVTYVRADAPPTLVVHGEGDRWAPPHVGRSFYEALAATGADVEWRLYAGKGHVDALFEAALDPHAPMNEDLVAFIERTTGPVK
jgi:acetyl esterase/lipase